MTLTFSKLKQAQAKKPENTQQAVWGDDYCKKIESCTNYHQQYSKDPAAALRENNRKSLVFKKEAGPQEIQYECWLKISAEITYFTITVSNKDKQLDSIRDEYGYSVPISAFRINENNELEIASYERCTRW